MTSPPQSVVSLTSEKGGVGKSTLAINLAGALALNGPVVLVDEDPIRSGATWAARSGRLPFPVLTPDALDAALIAASRFVLVDTEGRPRLEEVLELVRSSGLVLVPCGTSGLEIDATLTLMARLRGAEADLGRVRVVVTKAPPVGTVGQQARDALAAAGVPVARAVVRHYTAHQRAAELGVLVRDVPDPRAA